MAELRAPFRLDLLGAFRLIAPNGERIDISSRKGMALVALLAMAGEGERTRAWLQEKLWGRSEQEHAAGSLRRELSRLRKQLNVAEAPLLITGPGWAKLDLDRLIVDAREIEDSAGQRRLGLIPGEFLEGMDIAGAEAFEDWLREQRSLLRERGARAGKLAAPADDNSPASAAVAVSRRNTLASPSGDRMTRSLAVLPFDNLSDGPGMDYFSDGVSEEILQALARTLDLRVIGRSSSFQFRGRDRSLTRVAEQLGVSHVLEGSVQRSGEQVRVTAALIECVGQTTVWSARYDRKLGDVFALQDEIAAMVAGALQLVFAPSAPAPAINSTAHDLYLRARSLALLPPRAAECIRLLKDAVARAPNFAAAWATLAMTAAANARQLAGDQDLATVRREAIEAAERASALDPGAAIPFVARSLLQHYDSFEVREALLKKAMALAPTDPAVLKHMTDFACSVGRTREAFELIQLAQALDPLDQAIAEVAAEKTADYGLLAESYAAYAAARARWPEFEWAIVAPLLIAANLRDWEAAEPLIGITRALDSRDGRFALSTVQLLKSPPEALREWMMATVERQLARTGSVDLRVPMFLYSAGFADEAFAAVRQASFDYRRRGSPERVFADGIIFGVTNRPMRQDPRFVELCGRLALCRYWIRSDQWPDCVDEAPYDFKALAAAFVRQHAPD